jgi:hypothetical protein
MYRDEVPQRNAFHHFFYGGSNMKTLRFGTAIGLITAALVLAACTPPVLETEGGVQYGEHGERLVNLTLSMGDSGSARSVSADTSRTSINYYEVAFRHNDFSGMLYTKSFYRGETVRMAVPPGIYDNDPNYTPGHGKAILMAGHRDLYGNLRLLAWGIITGVNTSGWDHDISTGTGQTIKTATSEVEFTLIGIEYVPYDNTGPSTPEGFQITAPAAWRQMPLSQNLSAHKLTVDGSTREISYYPLPAQALGDTLLTLGYNDYYSKDIDGDGKWFDPYENPNAVGDTSDGTLWQPSGESISGSRQAGDVNDTDADDVITAEFRIKNLPDLSVPAFSSLIYLVNHNSSNPFEVNAIPVDIAPDPGIPMIVRHIGASTGPLPSTQVNPVTVTPPGVTGGIKTATQTFEVTLKTYPLPYTKSGGWALLNAQLHVKALGHNEPRLNTWTIQTGADLYALDEAVRSESLGGSILCAIGTPSATSISTGGILIIGNNP